MNPIALIIAATLNGNDLISALIWLVVIGLIFWLVWWLISYIGVPEPFNKVIKVVIALIAVIICINFLLGLTGHPLVKF